MRHRRDLWPYFTSEFRRFLSFFLVSRHDYPTIRRYRRFRGVADDDTVAIWNHANSGSVIWRLVDVPQKSTESKKLIKVCKRYNTRVHQNQTLRPPNAHHAEILAPTFSHFRQVVTEFNPRGSTLRVCMVLRGSPVLLRKVSPRKK